MRCLVCLVSLIQIAQGAVVIDRIAVIVGKHAIKASDIDRDVRLTEFLNREPVNLSVEARRKSAQRLIDQSTIRDEISTGGYRRATDAEAENMLAQLRRDRFGASESRLRQSLSRYGLSEDELRDELLWQLTVLRFIDERFRPAVIVTDEQIRDYYNEHPGDLKRQYPKDNSFDALAPKIRESLEGEKVNREFEAWLDEARKAARIEFREAGLA